MYLNNNLKSHFLQVMTILIVCLSISLSAPVSLSVGQINENYTYYGVVPSKIYRYILNDMNNRNSGWILDNGTIITASPLLNGMDVATRSLLAIVASEDNTNVEVRNLADNSLLSSAHLASMQKHLVLLANGTQFKVVSDKIVSVSLLNYQNMPAASATEGPVLHAFYTDVNGLYVGKKFVLMASTQAYFYSGGVYTILALEKATITVTRDGNIVNTYNLEANSYQNILLSSFGVYKFESTGNIMIQSGTVPSIANNNEGMGDVNCFPVPSAQGGFVGTFFLTKSIREGGTWDSRRDYGFRVSAFEDAKVKVFDLKTKQLLTELSVKGGTGAAFAKGFDAIAVQSDKPITLSLIHNGSIEMTRPLAGNKGGEFSGYGNGVMFIGVQPNQNTMIYLPTEAHIEAYFFAHDETQLTIDGTTQTIHANSHTLFSTPGTHTIQSNKNVILQINFWPNEPDIQGLWYYGTTIPCIETVNVNPTVTLTPIGEGFPMMYVIIGAGAAAVAVIVGLLVMRRRGSKPS